VLDIVLEEGFMQHVAQAGLLLRQRLAELSDRFPDVIEEIRGQGLMLGIKTRMAPGAFVAALRAQKLVAIPAGDNVVRLLPPLIISDDEILEGVRRIEAACAALSSATKTAGNA
jgi:acetylornithine/N-succinyldiaminopimelate aminotransferase